MLLLCLSLSLGCLCLLRLLSLMLLLLLLLQGVLLGHELLRMLLLLQELVKQKRKGRPTYWHSSSLAQRVNLLGRELHAHGNPTAALHVGIVRLLRHHLTPSLLLSLKHLVVLHRHGRVVRVSVD